MAKIRDSIVPNTYGEGNEKILTLDNGEEYIIRNSMVPDLHGEGYEKEIVKRQSASNRGFSLEGVLEELMFVIVTIVVWGGSIIGVGALMLFISSLLS